MGIVNINKILHKASKSNTAYGAYNVYALCQIDALIKVHEKYGSSLIIQVADPANGFLGGSADFMNSSTAERKLGAKRAADKLIGAASNSSIDICLHLDHGKSLETIENVIDAGFTSVMYDGSHLPYEKNVKNTKKAACMAHEKGASIEAELGVLRGVEDDVKSDVSSFTNPNQALDFVRETKVNCLAISYGTQHGANKGKNVKLKTDIVKDIKEVFLKNNVNCPLVSHGSSNVPGDIVAEINSLGGDVKNTGGISFEQISKAVDAGICKINIDTDIRLATTLEFRKYFAANGEMMGNLAEVKKILDENRSLFDPRVFLVPVMEKLIAPCEKDGEIEIIEELMEKAVFNICERAIPVFSGKMR